jgi:DNA-binding beta-propeller fold protein YncE
MRPTTWTGLGMLAFVAVVVGSRPIGLVQTMAAQAGGTTARQMPQFQVDPAWPKLPSKWVLGLVSNVAVDAQDHVWILQRPPDNVPKGMAAPPVLEFDAAGNFVQGWGGPGAGYEWPEQEHGIAFDQKGNVWLAGSDRKDSQLLKFTKDGKFVMQIGHKGQSKGNADTQNTHGAADVAFYAKTNEIFVADGYFNRRIIVFDADTGRFKRMWGAFGNAPTDPVGDKSPAAVLSGDGAGPDQFNLVHSVRISNDGLVYVTDRANRRVQVFTPEGKYIKQAFVSRHYVPPSTLSGMAFGKPIRELVEASLPGGSALGTAFSVDKEQRFLYVADRIRSQIAVLDRGSLEILGYFGDGLGPAPGQFYVLHDIAADSKGNLYTAEVNELGNKRAQKFVYKGIATAPSTR